MAGSSERAISSAASTLASLELLVASVLVCKKMTKVCHRSSRAWTESEFVRYGRSDHRVEFIRRVSQEAFKLLCTEITPCRRSLRNHLPDLTPTYHERHQQSGLHMPCDMTMKCEYSSEKLEYSKRKKYGLSAMNRTNV